MSPLRDRSEAAALESDTFGVRLRCGARRSGIEKWENGARGRGAPPGVWRARGMSVRAPRHPAPRAARRGFRCGARRDGPAPRRAFGPLSIV